jgi:DNA invertase Pin-like site-specific DNA recombinase
MNTNNKQQQQQDKKSAVIWCRVSSKEQSEEGFTLDKQLRLTEDYAEDEGLEVTKRFKVPESAYNKKKRKIFEEMMEYVRENNIEAIVSERIDRLTRNLSDSVVVDKWIKESEDHEAHFVRQGLVIHQNSGSNENLQWRIRVVLAQNYSDELSENIQGGIEEKARQGGAPGSMKTGYATKRDRDGGRASWHIDRSSDSEAPFIKKFFEMYGNTNKSVPQCIEELYEEGWERHGEKITTSVAYRRLRDRFYCGEFEYDGEIYDGNHEALVSKELYQKVQKKLDSNSSNSYSKHTYAYRGPWLVCDECGRKITAEEQKGIVYYHHSDYRNCPQQENSWVNEGDMEEMVLELFDVFANLEGSETFEALKEALKNSHESDKKHHKKVIQKLDEEYAKYDKRRDTLYEDRLDGRISTEEYDKKDAEYESKMEEIMNKKEQHQDAKSNYFEQGAKLLKIASSVRKIFLAGSAEEKQEILGFVFSNLRLRDRILLHTYTKPFQLIAERAKNNDLWRWRESNPRAGGVSA